MCGICGIISSDGSPVQDEHLLAMSSTLVHRGPDGSGIRNFGVAGLAHRRLSIIDLSGGAQPLSNEDGTVWISFNGEIYNFRELRSNLESEGHIFRTSSDTETIVHLYEKYGASCPEHLNGMFAFAIFDSAKRTLLLARDRLGKKPLYYFRDSAKFAFASELQALSVLPWFRGEIESQSLHDYLSLQYVPAPATIYKNVFKLPPAHTLELQIGGEPAMRIRRYWSLSFASKTRNSYPDAKAEIAELLKDSVSLRMISEVPLGAFLSGGMDSTIVAGLMSRLSDRPVKTFTIGFSEKAYDERKYANEAAAKFRTEHHEKVVSPSDFDALLKLVKNYGEPYSDSSMLPTYLLSRFTRESVTVALGGDGADELFAGYYRYLVMKFASAADVLPLSARKCICNMLSSLIPSGNTERSFSGKARRILKCLSMARDKRYFGIICRFDEDTKRNIYGSEMRRPELAQTENFIATLYDASTARNPIEKLSEIDIHSYLPCDILTKTDIASMACSLELRSPFLDYRIAEFAASIPFDFKQSGQHRKRILHDAFAEFLPPSVAGREKFGFGVPLFRWFREEWADLARERLCEGLSVKKGYFDRARTEKLLDSHIRAQDDHSYMLWSMLIFELWLENAAGK